MTTPKRWPNHAAWARDDTAQLVQKTIRLLRPLLSHPDLTVVARVAQALDNQQRAARYLGQVGASIPEDEL